MDEEKIILIIHGKKYDVTGYVQNHPGEGHNGIFLEDFEGKDVSDDFEYYHSSRMSDAYYILRKAERDGEYEGIVYLGLEMKNKIAG